MKIADRLRSALASPPSEPLLVGDLPEITAEADTPAAVLIAITERAEPGVILTVRREHLRTHAGQVAFPGGREETSDKSLMDTAIRETREETGIDLEGDGMILGTLDDLRPRTVRLPAIVVRPFVAILDAKAALELSSEVALAFWVPFGELARTDSWQSDTVFARGVQINARVFRHHDHIVWGMTERIMTRLLTLIED